MSNQPASTADVTSKPAENFAELYEGFLKQQSNRPDELTTAQVVEIDRNFVVVDAGLKSYSWVSILEFTNDENKLEVEVGDFTAVTIEAFENGYGDTILSRDKAKRLATWSMLEKACISNEPVAAMVTGKVKGGLACLIGGVRAFLPGSQVGMGAQKEGAADSLIGTSQMVTVLKTDAKRNNVVVSRRTLVDEKNKVEKQRKLETIEVGKKYRGKVKNLREYGCFVDLDGIDGLLHVSDMSYSRSPSPKEIPELGEEIEVIVSKIDAERGRISLSRKMLMEDPLREVIRKYPIGSIVKGRIRNIADYGVFAEIEESGCEGLVHVSEMDWQNKTPSPGKLVVMDQEVDVMVTDIDEERRRIGLSMKKCQRNPWEAFAAEYKKGDRIKGTVTSITDFGLFLTMKLNQDEKSNLDGLVHSSDLSYTESGDQAKKKYKKNDEVEAVILDIAVDKERICLGIKQLEDDPFNTYATIHDKGANVSGVVKAIDAKGAKIELAENVEGYLRIAEISTDRIEQASDVLKEGETVSVQILSIDRKARNIQLSMKAKMLAEQQEALQKLQQNNEANTGSATNLGALFKAKLDEQN